MWINYIKEKGEKVNKGEDEFSKEIRGKDKVNLVENVQKMESRYKL